MSKYSEAATTVRNQSYLVAALTELGYKPELHADGAALVGYEGRERPERAHVIIRRVQIGPRQMISDSCESPMAPSGQSSANTTAESASTKSGWAGCSRRTRNSRQWRTLRPRDMYSAGARSCKRPRVRRSGSSLWRGERCNRN
jgi:ribosomal protein L37AE/L43A